MPSSPASKRVPRYGGVVLHDGHDAASGSKAILAYMREHNYKPNDVFVVLYLKRVTRQYAVYANDALKIKGVYWPREMCSDPPAGTYYIRATSPFA